MWSLTDVMSQILCLYFISGFISEINTYLKHWDPVMPMKQCRKQFIYSSSDWRASPALPTCTLMLECLGRDATCPWISTEDALRLPPNLTPSYTNGCCINVLYSWTNTPHQWYHYTHFIRSHAHYKYSPGKDSLV